MKNSITSKIIIVSFLFLSALLLTLNYHNKFSLNNIALAEDDEEEQDVEQRSEREGEIVQMRVEVEKDINQVVDQLHRAPLPACDVVRLV